MTTRGPWKINFTNTPFLGDYSFRTATWSNATISVRNLNTLSSGLRAIQINNNWIGTKPGNWWFPVNQEGQITDFVSDNNSKLIGYNATGPEVSLPARSSVNLLLNLSSLSIPRNDSLQIVLLSTYGNYFTTFYAVPNSLIESSVNTENLVTLTKDVPVFDGSTSSSTNGSISYYLWRIDIPNSSWDGSWGDVRNIVTVFNTGSAIQYRPDQLGITMKQLGLLNITGPFRVSLITVSQFGFMSGPQVTVFNNDPGIAPPDVITAAQSVLTPCSSTPGTPVIVKAQLTNIFGLPVANGTQVLFQPAYGGPVIATPVNSTVHGFVETKISSCIGGSSAIEVEYGNLPSFLLTLN